MQEKFKCLLNKHLTKKNNAAFTRKELLTLTAEVKSAKTAL